MATPRSASDNKNGNSTGMSDVEAQLEQLRQDIAALAKTVTAIGTEAADSYAARARNAAESAVDKSRDVLEAARSEAVSLERDFEKQIRANPFQAVAIAAGVGFLVAFLARR